MPWSATLQNKRYTTHVLPFCTAVKSFHVITLLHAEASFETACVRLYPIICRVGLWADGCRICSTVGRAINIMQRDRDGLAPQLCTTTWDIQSQCVIFFRDKIFANFQYRR